MNNLDHLVKSASQAIIGARQDSSVILGESEPNEVARLVMGLPKRLGSAWSPYVTTGSLTVSGVFCHAKPFVKWQSTIENKSKRCELADLLIIFDKKNELGKQEERALLIQAKMGKDGEFSLKGSGPMAQRYMYSNWDQFEVTGVDPKTKNQPNKPTNIRCTVNKDIGTRYACIDSDHKAPTPWALEDGPAKLDVPSHCKLFKDIPSKDINAAINLADALVDIYQGNLGRLVRYDDDWSKLIKYLIDFAGLSKNKKLPHVKTIKDKGVLGFLTKTVVNKDHANFQFQLNSLNQFNGDFINNFILQNNFDKYEFSYFNDNNLNISIQDSLFYIENNNNSDIKNNNSGFGIIKISLDAPFSEKRN